MFYPEDELDTARKTLDEGQGENIEDSHEDAHHYGFDESDFQTSHTSFKKESKLLKREFEKAKKQLESDRATELSAINVDGDLNNDPDFQAVNAKYDKLLQELEDSYNSRLEELKKRYHEEITYHIHPKLKRRPELLGDKTDILLSVRNLKQFFFFGNRIFHQKLKAVSNVSFDVHKGECFGIVGESGCGKTTTGRTIIKLYNPTSGSIYYRGYRIGAGPRWNQK